MDQTTKRKRQRSANGQTRPFRSGVGWKFRPWVTFPDGTRKQVQGSGRTQRAAIEAAERNARQALAQYEATHRSEDVEYTLADACREFLSRKRTMGTQYKTLVAYESAIDAWIVPNIGPLPLAQVTYQVLVDLQNLVIRDRSIEVWRKVRTVLKQTLDEALREGRISSNPATLLQSPKIAKVTASVLTAQEAADVVRAARGLHCGLRWLLALTTGMRQGECLGLRWSNVDLDGPTPTLTVRDQLQFQTGSGLVLKQLKTDKSVRTIPLGPELVTAFGEHKQRQHALRVLAGDDWSEGDFVFTTREGRPIRAEQDRDQWRTVLKKAGVRMVKLHSARHTAATLMFANNEQIFTISRTLGHSSTSITSDIYGHVNQQGVGEAVNGVAALIS